MLMVKNMQSIQILYSFTFFIHTHILFSRLGINSIYCFVLCF